MLHSICALALVLAAQVSFAEPTLSSMVDFKPEQSPFVVDSDLHLSHGPIIKAPWYRYRSTVINNSPYTLVMTGGLLSTTVNTKGTEHTIRYILDPEFGQIPCLPRSECETLESSYGVYIHELPPKADFIYDMKIQLNGFFEDADGKVMGRYEGVGFQQTR